MNSVVEILRTNLIQCKDSIIANHIAVGQLTSGKTSGMFEVKNVSMMGGQLYGWQYYQTYETGRKPGRMPNYRTLIPWVEKKLGLSGAEARRAAYFITRKIERQGTSLFREGGRRDVFTPPIDRLFKKLPEELSTFMTDIIMNWTPTANRPNY